MLQVFPLEELAGESAFCYFVSTQKSQFLSTMCTPDWDERVFFASKQATFSHEPGFLGARLRCVQSIWDVGVTPKMQ